MDIDYKVVSEIPPGWTISQRSNAENAMRGDLGVQSGGVPLKFAVRPNVPTKWDHDGDGVPTTPNQAATKWLFSGDLSGVTRADIVDCIAVALDVNPVAVDAKIQIADYTHEEILQYLSDNAAEWGETVA